jgi:glycosyltransferase involved in cell wall biosynthesis
MVLSVVMPVRNGEHHVDRAIESILEQTFTDFELVVVDDSSTDGTMGLLDRWVARDGRVRVEASALPPGLVNAANEAVRQARGDLIARMDADDVSRPDRLRRQLEAFDRTPSCVLCGTLSIGIDGAGQVVRPLDRSRALRRGLFAPFPHGSAMFRRAAFEQVGGYRVICEGWEDLDLWARMAHAGDVRVIADALYEYRHTTTSFSVAHRPDFVLSIGMRSRAAELLRGGGRYGDVDLETPLSAGERRRAGRLAEAERAAALMWAGARRGDRSRTVTGRAGAYAWMAARTPGLTRVARRSTVVVADRVAVRRLRGRDVVEWTPHP